MNDAETTARLKGMHEGIEARFAELFKIIDDEHDEDEGAAEQAREEVETSSYATTLERHVDILLAGGGPTYRLDVTLDEDGDPVKVVALASWAGPTITTEVYPDSALWRFAESETSHYGPAER